MKQGIANGTNTHYFTKLDSMLGTSLGIATAASLH
jgi:hypothetical protein